MKLNRNEHSRFVQWLDRTAEKNPLLWLPCILLIALALAGEHIAEYVQIVYSHRNTEKIVNERTRVARKPFALRVVAMSLILALSFMIVPDLSGIVSFNVFADEFSDSFFAGGDGSVENPYQVATAEQLNAVRNDLSANYIQTSDIDLSVYDSWVPIGAEIDENNESIAFKGTYDGQNYTISNLTITSPNYYFVGLFGHLDSSSALISNVKLSNVNINLDMQSIDYENNYSGKYRLSVGAIAGSAYTNLNYSPCSITNCEATGTINIVNCYNAVVGGIIGYGNALDSVNKSNILVNGNRQHGIFGSSLKVGGITGEAEKVNGEIINCVNWGNINAIALDTLCCGGICGDDGAISYCINYGNIKGESYGTDIWSNGQSNSNVGGMVGSTNSDDNHHLVNYGDIESYAYGRSASAGGIAGHVGYQGSGKLRESYNLCNYIICNGKNSSCTYFGRVTGSVSSWGGVSLLTNNYSLSDTLVNGEIPTENIGHDQINGESLSKEEIEKAIENIINGFDIDSSELAIQYSSGGKADINNVKLYEGSTFSIPLGYENNQINSADILLRSYNDDSIICIIPKHIANNVHWDGLNLEWQYDNDTKELKIQFINSKLFDYFECNKKYYLDISNIKVNDNSIISSEHCKEKYSFQTGFSIQIGEQTFNFNNHDKNNFVAPGEKDGYHITKQMYDDEIKPYSFFKESAVKKWLKRDDWGGSCFGMSSAMILANTSRLNRDIPGKWSVPAETCETPYESRDIINYYHIIQDWYNMHHERLDTASILSIYDKALNINNIDDIFEISYYYDKQKKSGHSVVVVGAGQSDYGSFLYIYNPNNEKSIERVGLEQLSNYYNIRWMYPSELNKFTPESIKKNSRVWTKVENTSTKIFNGKHTAVIHADTSYEGDLVPEDVRYTVYGEVEPEMLIVLPPENYYEISSDIGVIDYEIANGNMFFAAKADNAEKSIVSAEDGIKLVNANGNFELTVSANENMPYNMFDISGIVNGDVDCQYINDEVVVNLDNTSDTTITFYHDLETEDYTVPVEYDKFIIGEQNNKEVVLVDTDGDGTYETDILNRDIHTHIPAVEYSSNETGHWHSCTLCDKKLDFETHTLNDGIVTLEPTETTEGIRTFTCTVCGHISTEAIPIITPDHSVHSFGTKWFNDGTYHWHECAVCGVHSDTEQHNENNVVDSIKPTATTAGTRTYSCSVCGYTVRTETIPPINDPNPPYPTYPTVTYPTNTDTNNTASPNVPYIYGDTLKSGWDAIISEIDFAADGSTVSVNMNGTYELPKDVVSRIQNRNINLELHCGGAVWTINGLDVTKPKTVNMRVSDRYNKIPASVINGLNSELKAMELRLYHSGDFGFKATLTFGVGKKYNNYYGALYHYNTKTKQLEFVDESLVSNRQITFELTHASYYAIAFNSVPLYDDISSDAGVTADSVPIDFANPTSDGVTIPVIKLPQIMKYSSKKRRYRILKKRRLDDLVFVL